MSVEAVQVSVAPVQVIAGGGGVPGVVGAVGVRDGAAAVDGGLLAVALMPFAPLKIRWPQVVRLSALKLVTMSRYSTPPPLPLQDQPR